MKITTRSNSVCYSLKGQGISKSPLAEDILTEICLK